MAYFLFLAFVYGLVIGSFLNVCIYRIPLGISVAKGRSFCPQCHETLRAKDLAPIFSYLFLKGRCRYCGSRISPRYPVIELANGLLWLAAAFKWGYSCQGLLYAFFFSLLLTLAMIDWDTQTIPDRFAVLIAVLALFSLFFPGATLFSRVLGFFIISLPMLAVAWFFNGFGGGDIKLMAVAGFLLGWQNIVLAFFLGTVLAALAYAPRLKQKQQKTPIPFGPWLALGLIITALLGDRIIGAYIHLIIR